MTPSDPNTENGNNDSPSEQDADHFPRFANVLDDSVAEEMNLIVDGDVPGPSKTKRTFGGAVLAAGMLGLGEVIEPTKTDVEMEQVAESPDPEDDPLAGLSFGELPPLN